MADTRTPDIERSKRPASSPAENEEEKRKRDGSPALVGDGGVDVAEGIRIGEEGGNLNVNDAIIARIVEAVSARVRSDLLKEMGVMSGEIVSLKTKLNKSEQTISAMKDELKVMRDEIQNVQDKQDDAEQYSRRNCVRVHGIPEVEGENTDSIVIKIGEEVGADIFSDSIDRSHRVGRKGDYSRPIICKFTSHKTKLALLKAKKRLAEINTEKLFNAKKVFVNEDLSQQRAMIATKARSLKKDKRISDTWTRDGVIFIRTLSGTVERVTTLRGLNLG